MHTCELCNFKTNRKFDLNKHLKSKKHLRNSEEKEAKTDNNTIDNNVDTSKSEESIDDYSEAIPIDEYEDELIEFEKDHYCDIPTENKKKRVTISTKEVPTNYDKPFDDMDNENFYIEKYEEPPIKLPKKAKNVKINKMPKFKRETKQVDEVLDDFLFSDKPTEILGKTKRELLNRISTFKTLFKEELKGFKIKKNATEIELNEYLEEMSVIVETGGVNQFVTDMMINSIKMVEPISTRTKFNISGLSDMLKMNPEFNKMTKLLYLKYNVFAKVPIEYQFALLIMTTAYICIQKNKNMNQIDNILNEPVDNKS